WGMGISLGMTEMKLVLVDLNQTRSVTEQRVDGSSALSRNAVRCTLVAGRPVLGSKISHLRYDFEYSLSLFDTATVRYNRYDIICRITYLKNLNTVISHFDKYPLISQK